MDDSKKCPVMHGPHRQKATGSFANRHWWPGQLNLKILQQNGPQLDPMGEGHQDGPDCVLDAR